MANIDTIKVPNGTSYELQDKYKSGVYFVMGTQTAVTGAWTGALHGVSALFDGLTILYYLPYNGSGNATLNLTLDDGTTTGAIDVFYTSNERATTHYRAGSIVTLTYVSANSYSISGTKQTAASWRAADYNENDTSTIILPYTHYTAGAGGIMQYSLIMQDDEGAWQSMTTTNGVATTKTVNTSAKFRPGTLRIYGGSNNIAANAVCDNNRIRVHQQSLDIRYSLNCGLTLTANKPLYLVMQYDYSTDTLSLVSPYYIQTEPTEDDDTKVYVLIGWARDSYRADFDGTGLMIYRTGGIIRQFMPAYRCYKEDATKHNVALGDVSSLTNNERFGTSTEYALTEGEGNKATGNRAHAEGGYNTASGYDSHAEGHTTKAEGANSHSEGMSTTASGTGSHSEGLGTTASGNYSHAEGESTTASGNPSHAEGTGTKASGACSHAEGMSTKAIGEASHAEGAITTASGDYSHAEGNGVEATGSYSHAEGSGTKANKASSHAEGGGTIANGNSAHAEGGGTTASGAAAHSEGNSTTASGGASHAEGSQSTASGVAAHAEGSGTTASGTGSHSEGHTNTAEAQYAHAEGEGNIVSGAQSHVEGSENTINSTASNAHAEGNNNTVNGANAHAEGLSNTVQAIAYHSHVEGAGNNVTGEAAHAEGINNAAGETAHAEGNGSQATGRASHAEGLSNVASGEAGHSEGVTNTASGRGSHAEGGGCTATGDFAHAEGFSTLASGGNSHAGGGGTIASKWAQTAVGRYNLGTEPEQIAFLVGGGTGTETENRRTVFGVSTSGMTHSSIGFTFGTGITSSFPTERLNWDYNDVGVSTSVGIQAYLKAYLKKIVTSNAGLQGGVITNVNNSTPGYVHMYFHYAVADYNNTGLPRKMIGIFHGHSGDIWQFKTEEGVFYSRCLFTASSPSWTQS